MPEMQWIPTSFEDQVKSLIESVDVVLCDIDGVLLNDSTATPGSEQFVSKLRKRGKKLAFVTNNYYQPMAVLEERLKPFGASSQEIVTPNTVLLDYLDARKFNQEIYIIGSGVTKRLLRNAGYKLIEYKDIQSEDLSEDPVELEKFLEKAEDACTKVGAVYLDMDCNNTYAALLVAEMILMQKKDILLLSGAVDDMGALDEKLKVVGPKYYIEEIERFTRKKSVGMAKPERGVSAVINSKLDIFDSSKVLMVGDNVRFDVGFAVNSGYQSCLVLTGVTTKEQVEDWSFAPELKPDYVVTNLNELCEKF
ncbi:hypothetical protein HUJ04_001815 [Dendroctonus ponderosae]